MGNIITQVNDDTRAYEIDATGNLSLKNTLNAKTGVFDNTSWFKQDIILGGTIDGVDVAVLKTTVDGMAGAGQGTFTGKSVAALNFTGTSGNFDNLTVSATGTFGAIKTSLLDINGNITSSVGPKYITASTSSGIKLENGSTTSNGYVQVNSNGSISIMPYTGTSLVLGGDMTGAGSINAGAGTFSSLNTSGALSAGAGTLSSLTTSGALSAGAGTFSSLNTSGSLSAGDGTLSSLTTSGALSAGAGTFSSLTTSGALSAGTGTFSSLTTSGALSAGAGTFSSLNLSSGLTGTSGTFSGLLTANGGLTLPSTSILTLSGSMTGVGNINAGAGTFSSLNLSSGLTGTSGTFSGLLTANNGLKIGPSTSANNWQINENTNGDLCFFRSGNAFACINNAGNLYAPSTTAAVVATIKVVSTDSNKFPIKTTGWKVNDKFVMKVGTNNVSRGKITSIVEGSFANPVGKISYDLTSSSDTTTTSSMAYTAFILSAMGSTILADNSNGVPATSLLIWA